MTINSQEFVKEIKEIEINNSLKNKQKMTNKRHNVCTGDTLPCTPAQPYPFTTDARQFPYHRTNNQFQTNLELKTLKKHSVYEKPKIMKQSKQKLIKH